MVILSVYIMLLKLYEKNTVPPVQGIVFQFKRYVTMENYDANPFNLSNPDILFSVSIIFLLLLDMDTTHYF